MANVRMRIAAGATVLGLGGLAGYALGSNDGPPASASAQSAALHQKPKVHKQVVHRTVNVHPKGKAAAMAGASPGGSSASPAAAPATAYSAPAPAPAPAPAAAPAASTPVSNPTPPVSTHTSGGGGSSSGGSYEDDGGSEHESEGGGDD